MSAARRLDWIKIKAILDPKDFSTVNQYRQRHTELTRLLAQSVPQVDLSQYRQQLTNQQVVSDIEQVLGQFKPKKAQVDSVLKDLDQQEQEAVKSARETVAKVEETVSEYKNNLDGLKNLPHHDQLTPEHVYAATPGLEKVYHQRLRDGKVFHDDHNFGEQFFG